MTKKTPKYLKLVVDNGKLIDQAYELSKEQYKLIQDKQKVQANITLLNIENNRLGTEILNIENEINKLERKVNGTIEGKVGRDNNINGS